MFDVERSSFITTPYGINATCEPLQNNLALKGDGIGPRNVKFFWGQNSLRGVILPLDYQS